jgi:hypothetical protein
MDFQRISFGQLIAWQILICIAIMVTGISQLGALNGILFLWWVISLFVDDEKYPCFNGCHVLPHSAPKAQANQ